MIFNMTGSRGKPTYDDMLTEMLITDYGVRGAVRLETELTVGSGEFVTVTFTYITKMAPYILTIRNSATPDTCIHYSEYTHSNLTGNSIGDIGFYIATSSTTPGTLKIATGVNQISTPGTYLFVVYMPWVSGYAEKVPTYTVGS